MQSASSGSHDPAAAALDKSLPGALHDNVTQSVSATPEALTTLTASVMTPATGRA
ncbi:hypothetical protein [Bifidobacterium porcinum]|uniref:hypothetical protein n=1 Tax=Bifidobacterium porcinum TaxID=212365 RepID=UPI000AAF3BC5|nr:hypothetical protein [Bifidobacterium porcinum]